MRSCGRHSINLPLRTTGQLLFWQESDNKWFFPSFLEINHNLLFGMEFCMKNAFFWCRGCLKKKFTTLLKIDFNPFFDWNGIYNGLDWLINTFLIIFWQDSVIFVDQLSKFWFSDGQSPLHFWWKKLGNAFFRKLECP